MFALSDENLYNITGYFYTYLTQIWLVLVGLNLENLYIYIACIGDIVTTINKLIFIS